MQQQVYTQLEEIFTNYSTDVIHAVVSDPRNNRLTQSMEALLQRCIEDLLSGRHLAITEQNNNLTPATSKCTEQINVAESVADCNG